LELLSHVYMRTQIVLPSAFPYRWEGEKIKIEKDS
jgi:hypothetical protein